MAKAMTTVGDVLRWWEPRISADRTRAKTTRSSRASLVNKHLLPCLGKVAIKRLTRHVVDDKLFLPMQQQGYKAHTIRNAFSALRSAFKLAYAQRRITENPMSDMPFGSFHQGKLRAKPPKLLRPDLRALVVRLVEVFAADAEKGFLPLMMLAHGTRIAETLNTRWTNIDLADGVWVLPAENTKTRQQRVIPLTEQVVALLVRYRAALPKSRLASEWVFSVRGGGRLVETSAHARLRAVSDGQWTSHDLRKLMRDCLADIGVDYMVAERLIGHRLGSVAETYLTDADMGLRRSALQQWHARLDACGFADAHGLLTPESALITEGEKPDAAGVSGESCTGSCVQ